MSVRRWNDQSSSVPGASRFSIGEGRTPLIPSRRLGASLGLNRLFFKLENTNPSGSYKDRFAAAAISYMIARGQTRCIATSSGNTGASLAAACAAAGIECRIAIVEGAPSGKLRQMMAYGARIAKIRRFGVDAETTEHVMSRLTSIGQRPGYAVQISAYTLSPDGMTGVESISGELAAQSAGPIDHVFCPAGGGGLCVAVARGFSEVLQSGVISRIPSVHCVQPIGNDTIAGALRSGALRARSVTCTSLISGLQVPTVIDGDLVIQECRPTGGTGHLVQDEHVWELQRRMAREEGIFSEPAGVVALAGAAEAVRTGDIDPDSCVVCLVTGSGFKDDSSIDRMNADRECPLLDVTDLDHW